MLPHAVRYCTSLSVTAAMITSILISITIVTVLIGFYQKKTNGICESKKRLDGKTAIVTGGTAGMGFEIAKDFARRGAKVIIVCPFEDEGKEAQWLIRKKSGNEKVIFKHLNLASFKSVRQFADDIVNNEDRLDILVNNAGVGIPENKLTVDGINFIMQVNYFGHFLLTLLLLPLLKKSKDSRIVNTASLLHYLGSINFENMNKSGFWRRVDSYCKSKYCMIPFSRELTRRVKGSGVIVNNVDPGVVGTRIFDSIGVKALGAVIKLLFRNVFKTAREGAQTAIYAAVDDAAGDVSGELFKDCKLTRGVSSAYNDEVAAKLWIKSVEIVKLTENELERCFQSA